MTQQSNSRAEVERSDQTSAPLPRVLNVDASVGQAFKAHNGVAGIPGPVPDHPELPDMIPLWKEAGVKLVRSYDWMSRLDTRDNPTSLFPDWAADPADEASYNFAATDQWVQAVHSIDADVLFTFASSIPANKLPALDVKKYGRVVEHIVRHYATGWADGPTKPVTMFEFGDQPDFGELHFKGAPAEFFAMYQAFAEAVRRVSGDLLIGGPSLAFPLNADAPYREGFLSFVRQQNLPLDFFSFLWFVDATRDPLDFAYVAQEIRGLLDNFGFHDTRLMLSYWNYLAVPSNNAPSVEKAAFQAAAAIYMQDTPLDYALLFRADSGIDPHYRFVDPAGVYNREGVPDERAIALSMVGRTMAGRRLTATGGDDAGFTCLASRDDAGVRVLIANFAVPPSSLLRRDDDHYRFRVPIGPARIELSLRLPPQRDNLKSADVRQCRVNLRALPWLGQPVSISGQSLRGQAPSITYAVTSNAGALELTLKVEHQDVILVEIKPR